MKTIQMRAFGGSDWHDSHDEICQILSGDRPEISDVRKAIVDKAMESFPTADRTEIEKAYDRKTEKYVCPIETVYIGSDGNTRRPPEKYTDNGKLKYENEVTFYFDDHFRMHFEGGFGQTICDFVFVVFDIRDEDAVFLPVKQHFRGLKYGNTVITLCHEPLSSYDKAAEFIPENGNENEVYSVLVFDKTKPQEWQKYK